MTDSTIRDLTKRLNQLEQKQKFLKRSLFGLSVIALALMSVGATLSNQTENQKDIACDTLHARKVVIRDQEGRERLILELESGEPTLKMLNHEGQRQIYLGIDEFWDDAAYLAISSRLENGDVDKQAVIAATTSRPNSPSTTQLILYDGQPKQKNAAKRHVVRLSSGRADQKPYLEIQELSEKGDDGVSMKLLEANPTAGDRRVMLDTNSSPATLSGVQVPGK